MARWRRRLRLGGLVVFIALAIAAGAGYVYETLARARERSAPPPGTLVDMGGFKLHLYCKGAGSPTVILDAGLGIVSTTWGPVQDAVSRETRVCSYDRAGYLWSDPGPEPRASDVIAAELHTLLERAGERPPFVVVGHSFGGYNVRVFAHAYPTDVVGMVLVDSSHEDQRERMPPGTGAPPDSLLTVARVLSPLGILRLLGTPTEPGALREALALRSSAAAARKARDFGALPLIVLTAGQVDASSAAPGVSPQDVEAGHAIWVQELQPDLARLSTRGERRIVADSSHLIQVLRPQAVVDAIESVLGMVRNEH